MSLCWNVATFEHGNTHGLEIARGNDADGDLRLLGHGDNRLALGCNGLIRSAGEGKVVDRTGRLDTRKSAHALKRLIKKLRFLGGGCELVMGNFEGHGEHVVRVEAGIDGLKVPETAQHETGANEQDDGECYFDGNQAPSG